MQDNGGTGGLIERLRSGVLTAALCAYGGLRVRDARQASSATLGRLGTLEVRLATRAKDVRRAQRLRYRVFYEERNAVADAATRIARRDIDAFDAICDHLLVLDHAPEALSRRGKPRVVGAYRLLRQEIAERHGGFYSEGEFAVRDLVMRHPGLRFLELGRSCVLKEYRDKRTLELLWHGVWAYALAHRIDVMFGCASFDGVDPDRLALPLAFLRRHAAASGEWRVAALPQRKVVMDRLAAGEVEAKAAMRALPPLVKGYLRLGATVGDGAVIDRQFGTVDVLIVLPVAGINPRYVQHFGPGAERHAA